jgi:spore cortex formation protein SpoVR/YcgB (stage V sporulation)
MLVPSAFVVFAPMELHCPSTFPRLPSREGGLMIFFDRRWQTDLDFLFSFLSQTRNDKSSYFGMLSRSTEDTMLHLHISKSESKYVKKDFFKSSKKSSC